MSDIHDKLTSAFESYKLENEKFSSKGVKAAGTRARKALLEIAKATKVTVIGLDDAPKGYQDFDKGAAKKFVIDPHGVISN